MSKPKFKAGDIVCVRTMTGADDNLQLERAEVLRQLPSSPPSRRHPDGNRNWWEVKTSRGRVTGVSEDRLMTEDEGVLLRLSDDMVQVRGGIR